MFKKPVKNGLCMCNIGKFACSIAKNLHSCELLNAPEIPYAFLIDLNEISSVILDKEDELGCPHAEIWLPDNSMKTYQKQAVIEFLELTEVDKIKYSAESHDCDDFAAEIFGLFAGLTWTDKHALNWFVDEDLTFWFIEPQTDKLSKKLEGWQGSWFRFFIGR